MCGINSSGKPKDEPDDQGQKSKQEDAHKEHEQHIITFQEEEISSQKTGVPNSPTIPPAGTMQTGKKQQKQGTLPTSQNKSDDSSMVASSTAVVAIRQSNSGVPGQQPSGNVPLVVKPPIARNRIVSRQDNIQRLAHLLVDEAEFDNDEILANYIKLFKQEYEKAAGPDDANISALAKLIEKHTQEFIIDIPVDRRDFWDHIRDTISSMLSENQRQLVINMQGNEALDDNDLISIKGIEDRIKGFKENLDKNEFLSVYDKQTRLHNFLKLYEKRFTTLGAKRLTPNTRLQLMILVKEKEALAEVVKTKRAEIARREAEVNQKRSKLNSAGEGTRERLQQEYDEALNAYTELTINKNKQDILAMDNTELKRQKWEADDSLSQSQITAVSNIDRYLFEQAGKKDKDRMIMEAVMGLTVRQRMAMYACIENGVDNMDYGSLVFSQANYLPSLEKIKSEMMGWKIPWARGRWYKVRRAYEYITNNKDSLDELVDLSINKAPTQLNTDIEDSKVDPKLMQRVNSTESKLGLGQGTDYQTTLEFKVNVLFGKLKDYKQANNEGNRKAISQDLVATAGEIRLLVDRKTNDENRLPWYTHVADGLKKACDFVENYYGNGKKIINGVNDIATLFPSYGDSPVATFFDGKDVATNFLDPTAELLSLLSNVTETVRKWNTKSASANAKDVLKITGNLANLTSQGYNLYRLKNEFGGFSLSNVENMRTTLTDDIAARVKDSSTIGAKAFDLKKPLVYAQMVNSAVTLGTAGIDVFNVVSSKTAQRKLKEQIKNIRRQNNDNVTEAYRKANYKKTFSNIVDKINQRKIVSAVSNVVCDGIGYLKYVVSYTGIIAVAGIANVAIKLAAKMINKRIKSSQDKKAIDDFLDIDTMIRMHKNRNQGDIVDRKLFRERALLELGFANTKTFFSHIAMKLGEMVHDLIENGKETEKKSCTTILKSLGLNVSAGKVPDAKTIAAKLSEG